MQSLRQSGFYRFMREHRDVVVILNPSLSELEVIAFLQAKWENLADKSKYEVNDDKKEAVEDEAPPIAAATKKDGSISQKRKEKAKEKNLQRKKVAASKSPVSTKSQGTKVEGKDPSEVLTLDEICERKAKKAKTGTAQKRPSKVIELS